MENKWEGLYTFSEIDSVRPWNKLILEKNLMVLQSENGPREFWTIHEIKDNGILLIKNQEDDSKPHELKIKKSADDQYEVQLRIGDKKVDGVGTRKDKSIYELVKRGFHWINEYPYNR